MRKSPRSQCILRLPPPQNEIAYGLVGTVDLRTNEREREGGNAHSRVQNNFCGDTNLCVAAHCIPAVQVCCSPGYF